VVSLARIDQDGLTHQLREEITTQDGQFGKNSSEDGLTHALRGESPTWDGQFGKNSSDKRLTHRLREEVTTQMLSLATIAQKVD